MKKVLMLVAFMIIPMLTPIMVSPPIAQASALEYQEGYSQGYIDAQSGNYGNRSSAAYSEDYVKGYEAGAKNGANAVNRNRQLPPAGNTDTGNTNMENVYTGNVYNY